MDYLTRLRRERFYELRDALVQACSENGGAVSRHLRDQYTAGNLSAVLDYEIDYNSISVSDAIYARQIQGLLAKDKDLELRFDPEAAALERFIKSEEMCERINQPGYFSTLTGRAPAVLALAARKIGNALGRVPTLHELDFEFGPGASTSVKASVASMRTKLSGRLECSSNLLPSVAAFLSETPLLASIHADHEDEERFLISVDVVPGKLQFVPKTVKTHRSIVVEPHLNSLFQKGVGSYLKKVLGRLGQDTRDQTRNIDLAYEGSVTGRLATVDLSMASDTIARELVFSLLPLDWACFLSSLRTAKVEYKGQIFQLQKFSSMGNAFTFELETLIFWSLATSCTAYLGLSSQQVSVYGDDIIIPVEAFDLLEEVLTACGFALNRSKSFASGPFRESCGADYLHGIDIRPFYVKETPRISDLFILHNYFIRHCEHAMAAIVREFIPDHVALYGPDGYGDGHLIGSWTGRRNRKLSRSGWEGVYFDTYALNQKRMRFALGRLPGDSVLPSYSVYVRSGSNSPTDPFVIRGSQGYSKVSIYTLASGVFR